MIETIENSFEMQIIKSLHSVNADLLHVSFVWNSSSVQSRLAADGSPVPLPVNAVAVRAVIRVLHSSRRSICD